MKVEKMFSIPDYHAQLAITFRLTLNFICAVAEDPGALREHETNSEHWQCQTLEIEAKNG